MNGDDFSKILLNLLEKFIQDYPERSIFGILLGLTLAGFAPALAPSIQGLASVDIASVIWWGWVAFGVLIFNIPVLFSGNHKISPEDASIIALIDRAVKMKMMPKEEAKQRYRFLIRKRTNDVDVNKDVETELKKLTHKPNRKVSGS